MNPSLVIKPPQCDAYAACDEARAVSPAPRCCARQLQSVRAGTAAPGAALSSDQGARDARFNIGLSIWNHTRCVLSKVKYFGHWSELNMEM